MRELEGNIWEYHPGNWIVIPTNGSVRKDGACVMGRGLALQAKERYTNLPYQLGAAIKHSGNSVHVFNDFHIISFPVKHNWYELADLNLIRQSTKQLQMTIWPNMLVFLPEVGCGNGGRTWKEVKPILETLTDNFIIVHYRIES